MATKHEIKKFLEKKKGEALRKLRGDLSAQIEKAEKDFVSDFVTEISAVKEGLNIASDCFDRLVKAAKNKGIEINNKYYGSPENRINDALSSMKNDSVILYFNNPVICKLKGEGEKKFEEAEREYNRLIAVTGSMLAKDGIELLKSLGFDTADLESPKESTALITNIDIRKLYIV